MGEAVPALPHMPSSRAQRQLLTSWEIKGFCVGVEEQTVRF